MADKSIGDLNYAPGTVDDSNTLFVVQQAGAAYKLSGHNFILALTTVLDGHGGVKSITYDAPVSPSLTGTMTITLADDSTTEVDIQNGKGITSISKTGTSGLVDTYTISYNDGTTSTFAVSNGAKGDTGDSWYVWIRYAGQRPTSDSDIGTVPDDWIGIYSGTASTAPTSYTAYSWYEYKGEKGDTGTAASITQQSVTYQESASGTVAPSGSWVENIPSVTPGNFLWTRTVLEFNDGTSVTSYSVSRYGIDGTGAVSTVNNIAPDVNGNIALPATGIPASDNQSVQAHITAAEDDIDTLQSDMTTAQADMADLDATLGNVKSDLGIVEDTNTATHTIEKGQYVIWKGSLYTASQAIPIDTTLSASNLTAVSNGGFNALMPENGTVTGKGTYIKFPDGTMIQRGSTGAYSSGSTKDYTVDLPTSFADSSYTAMATGWYNGSDGSNYEVLCLTNNASASQFKLHVRNATGNYTNVVFWIAIGRWK